MQVSIVMKQPKTCGCGRIHTHVPFRNRYAAEHAMYYFECSCGSTLVYMPDKEATKELIRAAKSNQVEQAFRVVK